MTSQESKDVAKLITLLLYTAVFVWVWTKFLYPIAWVCYEIISDVQYFVSEGVFTIIIWVVMFSKWLNGGVAITEDNF